MDYNRFGIDDISSYDHYLGFDLGHGETSCGYMKNGSDTFHDMRFDNNTKDKIFTAVYIDSDGKCKIGNEAVGGDPDKGNLYISFKTTPTRLLDGEKYAGGDITKLRLIQSFFSEAVKCLLACNSVLDEGRTVIIVGCPAGQDWLENDSDVKYANLLKEGLTDAGIHNIPIVVVPEPHAAMIKLQYNIGKGLDLTDGIMLFDLGSSTLDWSFLKSNNDRNPETASESLGGSLIEENMLASFYDDTHSCSQLAYPDFTLAALRGIKENFYISPGGRHRASIEFVNSDDDKVAKITPAFMTGITHEQKIAIFSDLGYIEGSWALLCEGFMSRIAHNYEFRNRSPFKGVIVLTGGVSRMPFVRDICMALFPEAAVECDGEPSYSVSRGLALYPHYEKSDLEKGITVYKRGNYEEAVKWYRKSADQGDASAQNKLGECYYYGHGVSQSYVNAIKWYQKSANQGYASAQYNLGVCYYNGYGVSQSYVDAVKWYRKSANQGNASAQYNLGYCYEKGCGVPQSYVDAVRCYQISASQGDAAAQYNLGYCYFHGIGVFKQEVTGLNWCLKSARQGNKTAIKILKKLRLDHLIQGTDVILVSYINRDFQWI